MGNLFHIGEVGVLMLVAYTLGWSLGYLGRRLSARPEAARVVPAERLALARGEPPPLERAGDAEPVAVTNVAATSVTATPSIAATPPVPDATPAPEPRPAVEPVATAASEISATAAMAAQPDAGPQTAGPIPAGPMAEAAQTEPAVPPMWPETDDGGDEFVLLGRPASSQPASTVVPVEAAPAMRPGVAWSGDINGHGAPLHHELQTGQRADRRSVPSQPASPPSAPAVAAGAVPLGSVAAPAIAPQPTAPAQPPTRPEPVAPAPEAETKPLSPTTPTASAPEPPPVTLRGRRPAPAVVDRDAMLSDMMRETPPPSSPISVSAADEEVAPPLSEIIAQQAAQSAAMQTDPAPDASPASPSSEDDAMRAIEGGWSRRRVRGLSERPEMIDVSAAVAAAQSAVQQVLAQTEIETSPHEHQAPGAGKPLGLPRARGGHRDNLREITGLSPLDESTLNNLGIYHFDQIAAWTQTEVQWLEEHVFARGRIGRETWQGQALELSRRRPPPPRVARP